MATQPSLLRLLFVPEQQVRRKQESIGYEVHNYSDLTLIAQALVSADSHSSSVCESLQRNCLRIPIPNGDLRSNSALALAGLGSGVVGLI
jgi:hypothetical protein